jgi:hypothetical protein
MKDMATSFLVPTEVMKYNEYRTKVSSHSCFVSPSLSI